ncbi:hypothetical protein A2801_02045 [Candidatus Woesebacteria bacterium RIFCSPHIGHO2_01_FULL_41_10]|uniref:Small ribosomal subunit protein bS20 n=1 Tax=Candidatus Woesebacteria bacterium RIFCSPHIGHO2_01_FULL_41_10 TaxID=1802500 RepID=A0A1F7YS14_9BACT|nr:MAG: hypothetical protein A2801_02045 [Candidatus Woesebacteria bacterium RIFCSPHIGHO2_01_FULL_41_10]
MPVTKTAKRALRVSTRKQKNNARIKSNLEAALRIAKSSRAKDSIKTAASLADRAVKTGLIKKNKASRIKSSLSHLSKAK